jgi:hypothetical protein
MNPSASSDCSSGGRTAMMSSTTASLIAQSFHGLETRFDRIETASRFVDLTRFLDANRSPLRLKTL